MRRTTLSSKLVLTIPRMSTPNGEAKTKTGPANNNKAPNKAPKKGSAKNSGSPKQAASPKNNKSTGKKTGGTGPKKTGGKSKLTEEQRQQVQAVHQGLGQLAAFVGEQEIVTALEKFSFDTQAALADLSGNNILHSHTLTYRRCGQVLPLQARHCQCQRGPHFHYPSKRPSTNSC